MADESRLTLAVIGMLKVLGSEYYATGGGRMMPFQPNGPTYQERSKQLINEVAALMK